ncbi:MAG: hypothetical protein WD648_01805 [Planctomycetaceae bacterium]
MRHRRLSPIEAAYPVPDDFAASIQSWREDAITVLMGYVWEGTKCFAQELRIDLTQDLENLERGLNQFIAQRIRDAMTDRPPFYFEHHPFEDQGRSKPSAAPKAPDLAFFLRANPRASLPIEAKVLNTDKAVAEYVKEITDNFLECRYAPFSSHGAMLGYLRSGNVDTALKSVATALTCTLVLLPALKKWSHHMSQHQRRSENCRGFPTDFTCHHLIVLLPTG